MTELAFLLDILLNHKIPKVTKEAITERIKLVESQLGTRPALPLAIAPQGRPLRDPTAQSASTQALLDKDPAAPPGLVNLPSIPIAAPAPTPATNRIKGGEVSTGGSQGTSIKGPRKF